MRTHKRNLKLKCNRLIYIYHTTLQYDNLGVNTTEAFKTFSKNKNVEAETKQHTLYLV